MTEYRIDDLARAAGMTTRNVRNYQAQGLLPPPRRSGRVGLYDDAHLSRLRLIGSLLGRGYTAAQISELLGAWEQGRDLSDVLGVERALVTPFSEETPTSISGERAKEIFRTKKNLTRATRSGLLRADGEKFTVLRPQLVGAMEEISAFGFPVEKSLEIHEAVSLHLNEVAKILVSSASETLTHQLGPAWVPSNDEVAELGPILQRLRDVAISNVHQTLAQTMDSTIEAELESFFAEISRRKRGAVRRPDRP